LSNHPSLDAGLSQNACILAELERFTGEWVSLGRLHVASGSMNVHSRISDLRKAGHAILQENRRKPKCRAIQSFYQLAAASPESAA